MGQAGLGLQVFCLLVGFGLDTGYTLLGKGQERILKIRHIIGMGHDIRIF